MGLDMYLTKKIYVGAEFQHRNVTGKIDISVNGKPLAINFNKIVQIEESVGYWRKANQIHRWFVENVQDGKDDCGEYLVDISLLKKLLSICEKVKSGSKMQKSAIVNGYRFEGGIKMPMIEEGYEIVNPELAEELLPTGSGFFFGSSDYNQYYMEDIERTIKILKDCVKDGEADFYYRSCW